MFALLLGGAGGGGGGGGRGDEFGGRRETLGMRLDSVHKIGQLFKVDREQFKLKVNRL